MIKFWLENNEVKSDMDLIIFNDDQMREILAGLEASLDVSTYAKPEYNFGQMNEIRLGLEDNLDVTSYSKPEYNWAQMKEIRLGLMKHLDVSVYTKPEYDWVQMRQIRLGLEENLDVSIYAKPEYNGDQMEEIFAGLEADLDVSAYAKPEYDCTQMKEIRLGLANAFTNDDKLVELCKEVLQRITSDNSYAKSLLLQICKRLNLDINKRYNDAEKILSQIISTGLHITSETVSKSDIFEFMFHLLTDLDFVDFVHNYRDQSASDNTPKKMDL